MDWDLNCGIDVAIYIIVGIEHKSDWMHNYSNNDTFQRLPVKSTQFILGGGMYFSASINTIFLMNNILRAIAKLNKLLGV